MSILTPVEAYQPAPSPAPRVAGDLLGSLAERRAPISLAEVDAQAALQTRVDRKFLLTPAELAQFAALLGERFHAMQIDGRRLFTYDSVYFDDPTYALYRAHCQGRRRRFKVRTRTYVDSDLSMLEAKLKGRRGETVKHRIRYRGEDVTRLTTEGRDFLVDLVGREYGTRVPALGPVMQTRYRRTTFVDPIGGERVTCDVDLACGDGRQTRLTPDLVVVETKTANGRGIADRALAHLGIRPVSMSKYAVGIALLHPEFAANRWDRTLRTRFDRHRAA